MGRKQDLILEDLAKDIQRLTKQVASLKGEQDYLDERRMAQQTIYDLKEEIEQLKISKSRVTEEHEKEKREVKHLVGLERKRSEWEHEKAMEEVDQARRQAQLEVREENLAKERETFVTQMDFTTKRMTEEINRITKLFSKLVPNIEVALSNAGSGNGDG